MDKVHDINNFLEKDGKFDLYNSFYNWLCLEWPSSNIDGLVQDCNNSSALAMVLLQSCTKPSILSLVFTQP